MRKMVQPFHIHFYTLMLDASNKNANELIAMKQICASFDDYVYDAILRKASELDTQKSKAVNHMINAYLQELEPLQQENARLKEEQGFLRSEFDKIVREIAEPLKLLTEPAGAETKTRDEVTPVPQPQPQPRTFLDKLLGRSKATS
jgi:hypothetical protein